MSKPIVIGGTDEILPIDLKGVGEVIDGWPGLKPIEGDGKPMGKPIVIGDPGSEG